MTVVEARLCRRGAAGAAAGQGESPSAAGDDLRSPDRGPPSEPSRQGPRDTISLPPPSPAVPGLPAMASGGDEGGGQRRRWWLWGI
jgi:hypothetical protein